MEYTTSPDMGVEEKLFGMLEEDTGESPPEDEQEEQEQQDGEAVDESEETEEGSEESDEETQEQTAELADVEFEGKQYKVPQELKDALLRQSDYTRKTQELSELRKQTESQQQYLSYAAQMQGQFAQAFAQLASIDNQIQAIQQQDWGTLIDNDPVGAMKQQHHYQELMAYRQRFADGLAQQQGQAMEQHNAYMAQTLQAETEKLQKAIPNWNQETGKQLKQFGQTYGFSEGELSNVYDHRMVRVLHDAMQYQKLKADMKTGRKKVMRAPAKQPLKPGARGADKAAQARAERDNLRKMRGRRQEEAATSYIEKLL